MAVIGRCETAAVCRGRRGRGPSARNRAAPAPRASRYTYGETLGRWRTADLLIGLAYLARKEGTEHAAADIAAQARPLGEGMSLEELEASMVGRGAARPWGGSRGEGSVPYESACACQQAAGCSPVCR